MCQSANWDAQGQSLVAALADLGVPAIIGFQSVVDDISASAFSLGFYRGLYEASVSPIDKLVQRGRMAMSKSYQHGDSSFPGQWALPVVILQKKVLCLAYQNSTEVEDRTALIITSEDGSRSERIGSDNPY